MHSAGASCCPITSFIKISSGIYSKRCKSDPRLSLYNTVSLSSSSSVCAGGSSRVIDDITQQGFSRRYYHGAGISMEPLSPYSAHRFGLLPDPNVLKEPSNWRNRATVQALGINFARALVFYHPCSSLDALHLLPPFCSVVASTLSTLVFLSLSSSS